MRAMPLPGDMQVGSTPLPTPARADRPATTKMCRPRVVGVSLPDYIGVKTFILGQPVLHRYYTVFNFDGPQMGFGLAAPRMAELISDPGDDGDAGSTANLAEGAYTSFV